MSTNSMSRDSSLDWKTAPDEDIIKDIWTSISDWSSYYALNNIRARAMRDFLFNDESQWDEAIRSERTARNKICLQNNVLRVLNRKITGEVRQNRPQAIITPTDKNVSTKITRIKGGLWHQIEYESDCDNVYAVTFDGQTIGGYGAIELVAEQEPETWFNQVLRLKHVDDATLCYWDAGAQDKNKVTGDCAGRYELMSKQKIKRQYPDFDESFQKDAPGISNIGITNTNPENYTVLISHYQKIYFNVRMVMLEDGSEMTRGEYRKMAKGIVEQNMQAQKEHESQVEDFVKELHQKGQEDGLDIEHIKQKVAEFRQEAPKPEPIYIPKVVKSVKAMDFYIEHFLLTGREILSRKKIPVKKLPLIFVPGEIHKNGKGEVTLPFLSDAVTPQKIVNICVSEMIDQLARAIGSRWVAPTQSIANFLNDYSRPQVHNLIRYEAQTDLVNDGRPHIESTQAIDQTILMLYQQAMEDIKAVSGRYNENLGTESNAYQYSAIMARQTQGDMSGAVYAQNLNEGIACAGKIGIEWMPYLYDTERTIQIRNKDGSNEFVTINRVSGHVDENGELLVENDMSLGKFNVEVHGGASFASQKMAGMQFLTELSQGDEQLRSITVPFIVEMSPFPFSNDLSRALNESGYTNAAVISEETGEPMPPKEPTPLEKLAKVEMVVKLLTAKGELEKQTTDAMLRKIDAATKLITLKQEAQKIDIQKDKMVADAVDEVIEAEGKMVGAIAELEHANIDAQNAHVNDTISQIDAIIQRQNAFLQSVAQKHTDKLDSNTGA